MTITMDDYVFLPLEEATTCPDGFVECLRDRWWLVHPDKGLAFYSPVNGKRVKLSAAERIMLGSPQCHESKALIEDMERSPQTRSLWDAEIVFMPVVYRRFDPYER
jgi:hypothetical protein